MTYHFFPKLFSERDNSGCMYVPDDTSHLCIKPKTLKKRQKQMKQSYTLQAIL